MCCFFFVFFLKATATTEISTYCHTLSLHAALPICSLPAEIPASACILGDASPQIWCDSAAGRLRRGLARAGVTGFATEGELAEMVQAVLVLRADAAIDGPLLGRKSVVEGKSVSVRVDFSVIR